VTDTKRDNVETQIFMRRPFEVNVAQVTPQNAAEIAEWCGGKVGQGKYKVANFDTLMDTVLVPGNGPNAGKHIEAKIGSYVVEHNGNFRVYRKRQFHEDFAPTMGMLREGLKPGDLVQDRDENDGVWQGEVVYTEQILVKYPFKGHILHDPSELTKIEKYSERIEKQLALVKEAGKGVPYPVALEKINALRADAEADHGLTLPPVTGSLDEPPAEINGITKGSIIRVKDEMNQFFSQCGTVEDILSPTMLSVSMEIDENPVVKHLVREVELEESTRWVRVSNEVSPQFGWVGWVVDSESAKQIADNENHEVQLVRVAFRPTTYLHGTNDRCFSYMETELTPISHAELGQVPVYEI